MGGRATSFEIDGHVVDNGQHVYLACCTEFVDFVARSGVPDALYLQERFDVTVYARGIRSVLRAGEARPPWHLAGSLLAYRHLSWSGKLQLARALLALRDESQDAAGNFEAWLRAHGQGADTIRAFWEPFMVPALNAPLDRMSAAEAAFVIRTAFLSDPKAARFGYARVPLAAIMDAAASQLDATHRSTAVMGIEPKEDAVEVRLADRTEQFDGALLALPPRALKRVAGEPEKLGLPDLDAYEASAIVDVHLWHDRGRLDFDFCALLDSPVQWIFQKGDGYLCCSLSAAGALVAAPTGDVVQHVWSEVSAQLPQLREARMLRGAATRNPEGTYNARPGAVRPNARTRDPKVTIAGAWTATGWPDTMESAVRSGRAAARALIEQNQWKIAR